MKSPIIGLGIIIATELVATLGVNLANASTDHPDPRHGRDIPAWVLRPCKTQDSVNCRWNAKTQGNGNGHTFVVRQFPGQAHMVCVMYTVRGYARRHDYCS